MTDEIAVRKYGLLAPLDWGEDCDEQLRLMVRFWNTLVEIEQAHRAAYLALTAEDETVAAARDRLAALLARRAALIAERKARRRAAKARIATDDLDEELAQLKPLIAEAAAALKAARAAAKARLKPRLDALDAERKAKIKAARQPQSSGLWWSNYNAVVAAYDRARAMAMKRGGELRFHSWRGEGRLVNQIQGGGIKVSEFLANGHAQIKLSVDPLPERKIVKGEREVEVGKRHAGHRYALSVTVHSAGRGARRLATFPIILHRQLPEDGTIKEVVVTRRKIASDERWHAVFLTRVPEAPKPSLAGRPTVAVNCGWRRLNDGLRVATVLTQGESVPSYVVLPEAILAGHARLRRWQSERDQGVTETAAWLRSRPMEGTPEPVAEALARFLRAPRPSARSLARVALAWREHRQWREDDFLRLEAWRKADKRLWLTLEHARDKLIGHRRDLYRREAARIAGMAGEIVVDAADWASLARLSQPDGSENELWQGARRNRHIAAVGELLLYIRQAAAKAGVPVIEHEGPATWLCHRCGHEMERRRPAALYQFCGHCDPDRVHPIDQDVNAVKVMAGAA